MPEPIDLTSPSLYINRELSMLEFQRRVLEEAWDENNPLLERLKFIAIFGSNMDEFFMVRVSGIRKQVEAGIMDASQDGMTPRDELAAIRKLSQDLLHEAQQYLVQQLDLENHIAHLAPVGLDYYTEAQQESEIQILSVNDQIVVRGGEKAYGEIQVTTQVVGFRKLRWFTNENLGQEPLDLPPSELQTTGYWLTLSESALKSLRDAGLWTNDPNDYGPDWQKIRLAVRKRDQFKCQVCGAEETRREHDVHHKTPFRAFIQNGVLDREQANRLENLTTLCPSCHRKVEQNVRIRSGLTGLGFVLGNLAPLFLMCDAGDLGVFAEPAWSAVNGQPSIVLYDLVPAGIGFSEKLFELHDELIRRAYELVSECACEDGCPSCVGPGGENGYGGKAETLAILQQLQ